MAQTQGAKISQANDIAPIYNSYRNFVSNWNALSTSGPTGCGYSSCGYTNMA